MKSPLGVNYNSAYPPSGIALSNRLHITLFVMYLWIKQIKTLRGSPCENEISWHGTGTTIVQSEDRFVTEIVERFRTFKTG